MIDGKTRLCGLIGNPVEHTMSPVIHNTLAEKCGHNLVYVPFLGLFFLCLFILSY